MYSYDLLRRDIVLLNTDVSSQVRHCDNSIGSGHTGTLNLVYSSVDIVARRTVKRCGMHMHYQRFARYALRSNTCKVGQPIVSMDNIELSLQILCDLRSNNGITSDLLHKVCTIFTREGVALTPQIACLPTLLTRLYELIVISFIILRRKIWHKIGVYMNKRHFIDDVGAIGTNLTEYGLNITRIHHTDKTLVLIARSARHNECNIYIVTSQSASHSVTGCTESSRNMWRKLPTKH